MSKFVMPIINYSQYVDSSVQSSERYIQMRDGVELRVIEFIPSNDNDKPIILFVAGWISLISGWKEVLKVLTRDYRVVYLETREKASSKIASIKDVDFDVPQLVSDIADSVEQVIPAGREYFLSGSSLGATSVTEYLMTDNRIPLATGLIAPNAELKFPAAVMAVIRLLPPAIYPPVKAFIKWYLRKFKVDAEKEPEQMAKYDNTLDAADPYKLKKNAFSLIGYQAWGRLHLVKNPVFIIGASSDTLHGLETIERMVKEIPDAELFAMESNKATHSEAAGEKLVEFFNRY